MQNSIKIDLVVILGKQLHKDGSIPSDLVDRLDAVVDYIKAHPGTNILVSGKYGLEYDEQGYTPTHYECDVMHDYLISRGIPGKLISKECESKDTISNITYAKDYLAGHPQYKNVMIVCASHHKPRVQLLVDTLLGTSHNVSYLTIDAYPSQEELALEAREITRIKELY